LEYKARSSLREILEPEENYVFEQSSASWISGWISG
jgi:hypothetical protein